MTETKDDVAGLVARRLRAAADECKIGCDWHSSAEDSDCEPHSSFQNDLAEGEAIAREAADLIEAQAATLSLSEARTAQAVADAYEDAARVAEGLPGQRGNSPEHLVGRRIAAAIRTHAAAAGEK